METKVPDRFTNEFFIKVLQSAFKLDTTTVKIESTNVKLATAAGDNYCSEIYRAKVVFSVLNGGQSALQQVSLIIKDMPAGEYRGEILNDMQVYEREVEMYCQTMPAMSKLLNNEFFSAKCLYFTASPCKMLVFQDLNAINYEMADRKTGLDYDHCRLIMQKLGKFHATSMVLAESQPETMKPYTFGMFNPTTRNNSDHVDKFFNSGLDALIKVASKWPGYESIVEKLQKIRIDFVDRMYKHVETNDDTIKVLNHGDLWVNNIMFKYNNEDNSLKPTDVVFVDYQMCFYTSPGIDINYFLCTSPKLEVRVKRQTDLINEYYGALQETLLSLNYQKIPTLKDIEADIRRKEFYGVIACVSVLPIVLMEKQSEKGSGMDAMMDEKSAEAIRDITYNGVKYQEAMKYNLKRFDELNILC